MSSAGSQKRIEMSSRLIAPGVFVLALLSSPAFAQSARTTGSGSLPPVPVNIEVPDGYSLYFKAHAEGTQNYICLPASAGMSWKFVAPQATLFDPFKGGIRQQLTTHFLSANASENGLPRPTWQHSFDSSRVWGRAIASSTDVNFVETGAIPWLLLEAVGVDAGPAGGSSLALAAFIQRLNTSGGVAPSIGCSQAADIGALALVPYGADYFFYRARQDN
jgi:hypothetical protein